MLRPLEKLPRYLEVATRPCWTLLLVVLVGCAASPARPAAPEGPAACAAGDPAGCERALLGAEAAELPALLDAYDATLRAQRDLGPEDPGWGAVWTALQEDSKRLGAVHDGGHADLLRGIAEPVALLTPAMDPVGVAPQRLLLALASRAGLPHLLLVRGGDSGTVVWHLLAQDPLGPHLPALPSLVVGTGERERLAAEVAMEGAIRDAAMAASRFDYVAAAGHVDRLRQLIRTAPRDTEPTLRARYALSLFNAAGIALEPAEARDGDAAAAAGGTPHGGGSPLGEYLRVALAGRGAHEEWKRRRPAIVAALPEAQQRQLDAVHQAPGQCLEAPAPVIASERDLVFAPALARALASRPVSATPEPSGELPLDDWLERYEQLARLVSSAGVMWSYAPSLLTERGEVYGLSAAGTTTYRQVTQLALEHVAALAALAKRFPVRFRPVGLLPLIYPKGVTGDPPLQQAVIELAGEAVAGKLSRAGDSDGLFDAAFAGLMAVMSFPPASQAAQLASLRDAVSRKLEGPIGASKGWTTAGLHAGTGVLGLLTGEPERLRQAAPRAAAALLDADGIPLQPLAGLAVAAGRYGGLVGTSGLDPSVANPAMFTPAREAARQALRTALSALAPDGPQTTVERQLLDDAVALGDGLVAAVTAGLLGNGSSEGPVCAEQRGWSRRPDLRDPLQRLSRLRQRALERPGVGQLTSAWGYRARLALTVLSDLLDVARRGEAGVVFALSDEEVERAFERGLADWEDRTWASALEAGYVLARAALRGDSADHDRLARDVSRVLRALAKLFGGDGADEAGAPSLFGVLANVSGEAGARQQDSDAADLLVAYAERSYAQGAEAQVDLLLFVALGVAVAREEAAPDAALALADQRDRPVRLPLSLNQYRSAQRTGAEPADPQPLIEAMRREQRRRCDAPDPERLIALRQALRDVQGGAMDRGLDALDRWLSEAEQSGLVVPRLTYTYEETTAETVFKVEGSLSTAADLLLNSGSLQVGLGVRTGGEDGGRMDVRFADPTSGPSIEEAARLYAHVAALTAVLHFAAGHPERGSRAAHRAVPAWAMGVRLGEDRIPAGDRTAVWAEDAPGIIAVAAQQALESGRIFLAGDLWTLVLAAVGEEADDERIAELLEPIPVWLRGLAPLEPVLVRARASLRQLAAGLPCTSATKELERLLAADCATYPRALAFRIANGLPALPRLERGAEIGRPACAPLRSLDRFLAAADQQRYDPDAFTAAVTALGARAGGHDAAVLLARQRHPQHCSPTLVTEARRLAGKRELGPHLQADLLSLAANCSGSRVDEQLISDLIALDGLTQRLPVPLRNLELTLFAARLALSRDEWKPLLALSRRGDFVQRWLRFGPELATSALLAHHAAHVMTDTALDVEATAKTYGLLCTTYPPADRAPSCHAIGVLRGSGSAAEKKRAAREALEAVMARLTVPSSPGSASPSP